MVPQDEKVSRPPSGHGLRRNLQREHGFEPLRIEGQLPADLNGTIFRNGPGIFEMFNRRYQHMFESDGAISAIRLQGGKAFGAAKVVESAGLREERAAGKYLYGYNAPWWRRFLNMRQGKSKNTANTNVIAWQNRLFALMEAAKPIELSMEDLSTIGETDFDIIPEAFSAHPHEVVGRNALYNFGLRYGRHSAIDMFELPLSGKARHLGSIELAYPVMMHDCMVTKNHFVFLIAPVKVSVWRALTALGPFEKLFYWAPEEGLEVAIVPIGAPQDAVRFHTDPFYQWHFANGYEAQGQIIIDAVRYKNFGSIGNLRTKGKEGEEDGTGRLTRSIIDPKAKTIRHETLWDNPCEFPRVHPARQGAAYEQVWLNSLGPGRGVSGEGANQITRLNLKEGRSQTFSFTGGELTSEPVFVPRKGATSEAEGYVLAYVFHPTTDTSYMGVWESQRLEDGPVAKVWFEQTIPTTFHGNWVPA